MSAGPAGRRPGLGHLNLGTGAGVLGHLFEQGVG